MLQDPKILPKVARLESTYSPLRYFAIATVAVEFAETLHHLRVPPTDEPLAWQPATPGQKWGDNWVTAWFRGQALVPASFDGETVYVRAQTGGPETLFYVDGSAQGVFDVNHPVRLLTLEAEPGRIYRIDLESYAGHTIPGTQPFSGIRSADGPVGLTAGCREFEKVELVVERPEVSEFVFALRTLLQVASGLEESSLRRARIQSAMGDIFRIVPQKPQEIEEEQWRSSLSDAIDVMRPLLDLKNGPSVPTMGVFGHSHIDTAWLWPVAETWRKCARTFSSVLSLMDQYPEFRFSQSAALHFDMMRKLYPDIFERVRERVKEGRWEIIGCMWIEPDCNIPSGESFVRQCLYGQRALREMFGLTSDTLWQPDVFGYSAALPQILRKSGVEFFCTTKLSWNDTNHFPYDTFHWQGIDGSTVLAHFNEMQGWADAGRLIELWKQVQHPDVQDRRLVGFGHGDGGGGPMAEMIEVLRYTGDLEGCPRTEYQGISEFMAGCRDELTELPRWVGELYLELHRGTLTSIAAIKRGNRQCEFALRDAEFAATVACVLAGSTYPTQVLDDTWKVLLLNHFHDILPGSAIAEVNDEAIAEYAKCLASANEVRDAAWRAVAGQSGPQGVLIANSLGWERAGEVTLSNLPSGFGPMGTIAQEVAGPDGVSLLAVQGLRLPSLGFQTVALEPLTQHASAFRVTENSVETPFALVWFDEDGRIVSFYDREARRELVKPGGAFNCLLMGEDVPAAWDNWDIDRDQRHKLEAVGAPTKREVVADGPLQLRVRQEFELGRSSKLTQDIVFHATTGRVDFDTRVDWHEKYQFLKVGFEPDILAETALHEIQFGHVQRNSHDNTSQDRAQFDVCAHKWTDISENGYGIAFLNDCKYACTVKAGEYRLSLIKAGRHPDSRGDEGIHRFSYAMLPHGVDFGVESVVRPAYEFNVAPTVCPASTSAGSFSLLGIENPNIVVAAIKKAEDDDDLIIRMYEAGKSSGYATIRFGMPVVAVSEVDLLEESATPIAVDCQEIELYFRPFEIKTLKIQL
ncbi:MAG: glycoside hydrolase family 38 C-terminal domain-containing protein [Fimbriimonas sp.]|nr:glycoside hydrolase family 38 C-terminal domain-containing protein [Fimbriimonas sp.]